MYLSSGLDVEELVLTARLYQPVMTLSRIRFGSLLLAKCLVQTEIMTNGVLPTRFRLTIPSKCIINPLVNLRERELSIR